MAAAVNFYAALQKFKERRRVACWVVLLGVFGALGTFEFFLFFSVSPAFCGLALLCCSFCLKVLCLCRKEDFLTTQGKAVLITGCDMGISHALAKTLSDMGVKVFAGVLNINGSGAQQLRDQRCENLQVLQLDVTDECQIQEAHRYICTQVGQAGLWGLVNNAGILHYTVDAEIHPITEFKHLMDVNFLSPVKMCQVFLPLLRRSRGRIVNVTSMAVQVVTIKDKTKSETWELANINTKLTEVKGEVPVNSFFGYRALKAALIIFSKTLRLELVQCGIKVAIVQPSFFKTNIFGNSESIRRYREEILNGISSEAREDYGEEYISALCSCLSKMEEQSSENLRPVVDDMCHALLSAEPKLQYTPGRLGWLLCVTLCCLRSPNCSTHLAGWDGSSFFSFTASAQLHSLTSSS
ncbi:hypothetical protein LDENG_00135510 [Lucifuga dentata]|nr:hypothetical protein LDENG_00135510 [Lucifuga dentata]